MTKKELIEKIQQIDCPDDTPVHYYHEEYDSFSLGCEYDPTLMGQEDKPVFKGTPASKIPEKFLTLF